jgi:CHASE3 domain sensor protein
MLVNSNSTAEQVQLVQDAFSAQLKAEEDHEPFSIPDFVTQYRKNKNTQARERLLKPLVIAKEGTQKLASELSDTAKQAVNTTADATSTATNSIKDGTQKLASELSDTAKQAVNTTADATSTATNSIKDGIKNVFSVFSDLASSSPPPSQDGDDDATSDSNLYTNQAERTTYTPSYIPTVSSIPSLSSGSNWFSKLNLPHHPSLSIPEFNTASSASSSSPSSASSSSPSSASSSSPSSATRARSKFSHPTLTLPSFFRGSPSPQGVIASPSTGSSSGRIRPPTINMSLPSGRNLFPSSDAVSAPFSSLWSRLPSPPSVSSVRGSVTSPLQRLGERLDSVTSPLQNMKRPHIKIPDTSWSSNDEDYGQLVAPPVQTTSIPYAGSYWATFIVSTQVFVARHSAILMLLSVLCLAIVLLCAGLYLQNKQVRDNERDAKEREWGVCRTVQDVLRNDEQEKARIIPKMKYYPVVTPDLRRTVVLD